MSLAPKGKGRTWVSTASGLVTALAWGGGGLASTMWAPRAAAADARPASADDDENVDTDANADDAARPRKKSNATKAQRRSNADDESGDDNGARDGDAATEAAAPNPELFFIDKVDTPRTVNRTLVQGNFVASTFYYSESGGLYPNTQVNNASPYSRFYTDLRAQMDARHLAGGKWDVRLDGRARMVAGGGNLTEAPATPSPAASVQSGAFGDNEFDLREAWAVRSGKRSDLFIGRQYIADLGALKIDGARLDYALSKRVTLLMFGGAFPMRGSRSLATDYPTQYDAQFKAVGRTPPLTVGAGGAYRTHSAYGAVGSYAVIPLKGEAPRISVTANGYWRRGALDLFHFGLIDLFGASGFGLTNISGGANYKPSPRLRLAAAVHRMDIDTLAVSARWMLQDPATNPGGQNNVLLRRYATNAVRGGASFALGASHRFEVSLSSALRFRPSVTLASEPNSPEGIISLPAEQGLEVGGAVVDRRSILGLRLGLEAARFLGVGSVAFARSDSLLVRGTMAREFAKGRGSVEVDATYTQATDAGAGTACMNALTCYGAAASTTVNVGATVYYRITPSIFGLASGYYNRQALETSNAGTVVADPAIGGTALFLRLAYRY